jgi:hypothetical protein
MVQGSKLLTTALSLKKEGVAAEFKEAWSAARGVHAYLAFFVCNYPQESLAGAPETATDDGIMDGMPRGWTILAFFSAFVCVGALQPPPAPRRAAARTTAAIKRKSTLNDLDPTLQKAGLASAPREATAYRLNPQQTAVIRIAL